MKGLVMGLAMLMAGCTLGNGVIDPVENAVIRVAVGTVLAKHPELIAPAYAVSTGMKVLIGNTEKQESLSLLEQELMLQLSELDLSLEEQIAAETLIGLLKEELTKYESDEEKRVVLRQLVYIVNETARCRLKP